MQFYTHTQNVLLCIVNSPEDLFWRFLIFESHVNCFVYNTIISVIISKKWFVRQSELNWFQQSRMIHISRCLPILHDWKPNASAAIMMKGNLVLLIIDRQTPSDLWDEIVCSNCVFFSHSYFIFSSSGMRGATHIPYTLACHTNQLSNSIIIIFHLSRNIASI